MRPAITFAILSFFLNYAALAATESSSPAIQSLTRISKTSNDIKIADLGYDFYLLRRVSSPHAFIVNPIGEVLRDGDFEEWARQTSQPNILVIKVRGSHPVSEELEALESGSPTIDIKKVKEIFNKANNDLISRKWIDIDGPSRTGPLLKAIYLSVGFFIAGSAAVYLSDLYGLHHLQPQLSVALKIGGSQLNQLTWLGAFVSDAVGTLYLMRPSFADFRRGAGIRFQRLQPRIGKLVVWSASTGAAGMGCALYLSDLVKALKH